MINKPFHTKHPNPRHEALAVMWAAGKSYAQIGAALGMSRSAVAGQAWRLGLVRRPSDRTYEAFKARCRVAYRSRERAIGELYLIAAGMRADGESYEAICAETGLSYMAAVKAVLRSRRREQREEAAHAQAA